MQNQTLLGRKLLHKRSRRLQIQKLERWKKMFVLLLWTSGQRMPFRKPCRHCKHLFDPNRRCPFFTDKAILVKFLNSPICTILNWTTVRQESWSYGWPDMVLVHLHDIIHPFSPEEGMLMTEGLFYKGCICHEQSGKLWLEVTRKLSSKHIDTREMNE